MNVKELKEKIKDLSDETLIYVPLVYDDRVMTAEHADVELIDANFVLVIE